MKLRDRRACTECGTRWSYFETGGVACPACGSVRSVALDESAVQHTAGGTELDLTDARRAVDDRPIGAVAERAAEASRAFLVDRGFIDRGELKALDDVTVAAAELRQVAHRVDRAMTPDEDVERYLLALLRGAPDGERPDEVPEAYRAARGMGIARAVERYRADLARHLDEHPDADGRRVLGTLRDHLRRVEALEGDVPAEQADRLLGAARSLGEYLRGDDAALARAEDRLSRR